MEARFGFIGTGHMGGALARAVCRAAGPERVLLANRTAAKAQALSRELGCRAADNAQAAREADYLFLGVKPQGMAALLSQLAPALAERRERPILVSMAAGLTLAQLEAMSGGGLPIIRIMPNTAVAVGEGVVFYAASSRVPPEALDGFLAGMAAAGRMVPLEEGLLDAASAVAGCGGAFCALFLEALADGGVACGLPRDMALTCAAQMVLGTARLMLESGKHPAVLKDEVCSPGGSTIQGVRALERAGFRAAAFEAVVAACERTKELGK